MTAKCITYDVGTKLHKHNLADYVMMSSLHQMWLAGLTLTHRGTEQLGVIPYHQTRLDMDLLLPLPFSSNYPDRIVRQLLFHKMHSDQPPSQHRKYQQAIQWA